jgi:hypothetical protein
VGEISLMEGSMAGQRKEGRYERRLWYGKAE